jgi:hypothetical protein
MPFSVVALIEKYLICWVPVAHTYNPSYSGGRDQEDWDSKPAQADSENLSGKHPSLKRAVDVAQVIGPEFKPQNCQKNKQKQFAIQPRLAWNKSLLPQPHKCWDYRHVPPHPAETNFNYRCEPLAPGFQS